jgi:hypothetical protein
MLNIHITDADGTKEGVFVKDNALVVSQFGCPPMISQKNKVFRQYFTDDGTASGTSSMLVDGSSTNVDYYIPAHADNDRYITAVSFLISDAGAELDEFGGITALTNGCVFEYSRVGETVTIHDALKSNWDFIRLCLGAPAFGDAATAFQARNVVGASEAYIPVFNFLSLMPPYGLKLDAGTRQRLTLRIRDNCSTIDGFDAIGYGFERFS